MRFRIQGGTANHGEPSLCYTCRFATIIRGHRLRHEIIDCGRLSDRGRITFRVTSCTAYADRRRASLRDMEEIAWVLRSDPRRNKIGFVQSLASRLHCLTMIRDAPAVPLTASGPFRGVTAGRASSGGLVNDV